MTNLRTLTELAAQLRPNARLLGLDLGSKTIGLATATMPMGIATALTTMRRTAFQADAKILLELARKENVAAFILGLPLNMDGSAGPRVQSTRAFARNLSSLGAPPILLFDERLTSSEAEDQMIDAGLRYWKRADLVDSAAARIILQGAIDGLKRLQGTILG
jgi:putative holliday junction resolvase